MGNIDRVLSDLGGDPAFAAQVCAAPVDMLTGLGLNVDELEQVADALRPVAATLDPDDQRRIMAGLVMLMARARTDIA